MYWVRAIFHHHCKKFIPLSGEYERCKKCGFVRKKLTVNGRRDRTV